METRVKFICVSLLLCLAIAGTFFTAAGTIQAYQQFEQDHQLVVVGDVSTVSSWMTLPYISRVYHVPAACLYGSLHIPPNPFLTRHATLGALADRYKRPVNVIIREVQQIILNYRHKSMSCGSPPTETARSSSSHAHLISIWRGDAL